MSASEMVQDDSNDSQTVPQATAASATRSGLAGARVWVIVPPREELAWELLGDAREAADRLQSAVLALTGSADEAHAQRLIAHGADVVLRPQSDLAGPAARLDAVSRLLSHECPQAPQLVFVSAAGDDRALAARLAVRCRAVLCSPALSVRIRNGLCQVTVLHPDGRRARDVPLEVTELGIVVLRPGVAEARAADPERRGTIRTDPDIITVPPAERLQFVRQQPADPAVADIQHLPRLIAGGRGVGGREGFDRLRRLAEKLDAGVAASRMAVDLGWIERERQVGQTGKSVSPELYIACGISGASHHLDGMSSSRHIVALNSDPQAAIFRAAHLGLVCDCQATVSALTRMLEG